MIRTQIYLPEKLLEDSKRYAARQGVSMAEVIRQALEKLLHQKAKTKDPMTDFEGFIGMDKSSKPSNAVEDIHDYYQNF